MVPLTWYLILAAGLFCVGRRSARCARRNAVGVLMGIELMLNAVNINLVAFWRYTDVSQTTGQMFAIFVIADRGCRSCGGPGAAHRHLPAAQYGQR